MEIALPHLCQSSRKTTEEKMTNDQVEWGCCILLPHYNCNCQSSRITAVLQTGYQWIYFSTWVTVLVLKMHLPVYTMMCLSITWENEKSILKYFSQTVFIRYIRLCMVTCCCRRHLSAVQHVDTRWHTWLSDERFISSYNTLFWDTETPHDTGCKAGTCRPVLLVSLNLTEKTLQISAHQHHHHCTDMASSVYSQLPRSSDSTNRTDGRHDSRPLQFNHDRWSRQLHHPLTACPH